MERKSRRKFLTDVGITLGAFTIGRNVMEALPALDAPQVQEKLTSSSARTLSGIDFRYAPASWQSTYCFPDDPHKSLVGKYGELLYGHPGVNEDFDKFAYIVSVGIAGREPGKYVSQRLESPQIPIITTVLEWDDASLTLVSFASNHEDEGRVDNVLLEYKAKSGLPLTLTPEVRIKSEKKFVTVMEDNFGIVHLPDVQVPFLVIESNLETVAGEGGQNFHLQPGTISSEKTLRYVLRFPQAGQEFKRIKERFDEPEKLIAETRLFWQAWKPVEGKVQWKLPGGYQDFLVASSRNIAEAREVKNGKTLFQVGPTVYRGLWVVDGNFLLEAARYLGEDKAAQEGLEAIWDMQKEDGSFTAGAGEKHWKDTAVAVWALIRQAELSRDWTFFNQLYPDAHKALMYLKGLREKALQDGTANGKYGLLPKGFGDSGIGGVRSEFTNTIWALVATKRLLEVADKQLLPKREELRELYTNLRTSFLRAATKEMRKDPGGFSYLPMLMQDDPKWSEADPRKQPRPQAAQIYLSQAIYPGLLLTADHAIVKGHLDLMKAVMQEDIPAETGWLSNEAVWPYNAAIAAQAFLWAGMTDLARKMFIGFLNHASPLYAWREEQSLQSAKVQQYIGDMPHNWASAECIRYLRHMIILEDEKILRLFDGLGLPEMMAKEPIVLTYSPTKWGRISVTLEPIDRKTWRTTFKREEADEKRDPLISYYEMPYKLPGEFYIAEVKGATRYINGYRAVLPADSMSWECTWKHL